MEDPNVHAGALVRKNIRACPSKSDLTGVSATGGMRLDCRPLCHVSRIDIEATWETQNGDLAEILGPVGAASGHPVDGTRTLSARDSVIILMFLYFVFPLFSPIESNGSVF